MVESSSNTDRSAQDNKQYTAMIWQYKQAETIGLMINVGNRLGLFTHLAGAGAMSAAQLAAKSGCHERWLLEWMRLQTAARILEYCGDDRFELPKIGAEMLADQNHPRYAAENFNGPVPDSEIDALLESFRTGLGRSYESAGPNGARRGEDRHWRGSETAGCTDHDSSP